MKSDVHIVWDDDAGNVMITTLAPQGRLAGETEEQWVARVQAKNVPAAAHPRAVTKRDADIDEVLKTKFNKALRLVASQLVVDLPAAKEHLMELMREQRDKRFEETDKTKIKLDDIGTPAQVKAARDHRKALRDLPVTVQAETAALTLPQLEAYAVPWPVESES